MSHDTCFLNNISTGIIELQSTFNGRSASSLKQYSGDFYTYERVIEDELKARLREKDALDTKKEKLKEFIGREGKKYDGERVLCCTGTGSLLLAWLY